MCSDSFTAEVTKKHNNANVLIFGARFVGYALASEIIDKFIHTEFSYDERHVRRLVMMEEIMGGLE